MLSIYRQIMTIYKENNKESNNYNENKLIY